MRTTIFALLLLAFSATVLGATRSVAVDGSDNSNCLSVPCRTLTYAIAQATAGEVIQVGPGNFGPLYEINKPVVLRGHQAGVDARGRTGAESILAGNLRIHSDDVVLDGFTVECTSCSANIDAGLVTGFRLLNSVIRSGGLQLRITVGEGLTEVRYNDFVGVAKFPTTTGLPGPTFGLYIDGQISATGQGSLLVDSNRFANHSAAMISMSGVSAPQQSAEISNNQFLLGGSGHAIHLAGVDGLRITGNSIQGGGDAAVRLLNYSRNVLLARNTISGNTYAAVETRIGGDALRIESNTFTGNMRALVLATDADAHLNRFAGNHVDIEASAGAVVDGENNWFGCNEGPARCGSVATYGTSSLAVSPWLVMTVFASPGRVAPQRSSVVVADLSHNSDGALVPGFPDGTLIAFAASGGSVQPAQSATRFGVATTTFTAPAIGEWTVSAKLDDEEVSTTVVASQPRRRAVGN
jgi:hypothetical protein